MSAFSLVPTFAGLPIPDPPTGYTATMPILQANVRRISDVVKSLFAKTQRPVPCSTFEIFQSGDGFKMFRVHAGLHSAKMIKLKSVRYMPHVFHVHEPVGHKGAMKFMPLGPDAVSAGIKGPQPDPASFFVNTVSSEPVLSAARAWGRGPMPGPARIMPRTESLDQSGIGATVQVSGFTSVPEHCNTVTGGQDG